MSLSDKYGSNPAGGHRFYNIPTHQDSRKTPVRTFLDFRHADEPDGVDAQRPPPPPPLSGLRSVSKMRLLGFLLGLTLTFLIMASYILPWNRAGLLFAPTPVQLRTAFVPVSVAAAVGEEEEEEEEEESLHNSFLDMKVLVKVLESKLEYPPRTVPLEKDVKESESELFSILPRHFLPNTKSPCWYQEFVGDPTDDPYSRNLFTMRGKGFKAMCEQLKTDFQRHLVRRDGKVLRLRCLPYFYVIGQPKCGTTDLFQRLRLHPQVRYNAMKEPHWWTRKRFGYIHFKDGFLESFPLHDYLDLFDLAAVNIQAGISGNTHGDRSALRLITGEASASTMWDNQAWSALHPGGEDAEPRFLAQDFIHAAQPAARIIVMLRDPVERLYSDYLYFTVSNKSAEDFHLKVVESVQLFQSCLSERTLRYCAYDTSLSVAMPVRLNLGMYIVFLLDWLTVFRREQILVLRLEEYAANIKGTLKKVFDFLNVGPLSEQVETAVTKQPLSNTRRAADRNLGPMLPATRDILGDFYQPLNHKLAVVLHNEGFLWNYT